jgi:hypothetical protein
MLESPHLKHVRTAPEVKTDLAPRLNLPNRRVPMPAVEPISKRVEQRLGLFEARDGDGGQYARFHR